MLQNALDKFRKPNIVDTTLYGVMLFCALIDFPSNFRVFGISGVGAGTFAAAGLIWALFLTRPVVSSHLLGAIFFLLCFEAYGASTVLWGHTGKDGIQQMMVGLAFTGIILVTAREADADPGAGHRMHRGLLIASALTAMLFLLVVYIELRAGKPLGEGDEDPINPRPFALHSLVLVSVALARWRGSPKTRSKVPFHLLWALLITFFVALSMSRTGLVCCMVLFPLSIVLRLNTRSFVQAGAVLAAGAGVFAAALFTYKPLYNRFFAYDASMKVGGVAVNASGRTKIWETLYSTIGHDWLTGKGLAASVLIIRDKFHALIEQPHNDYLRFYYDTGLIGLTLWLLFAASFLVRTFQNLSRSIRYQTADYPLHIAAILAFFAVSWAMLTDNPIVYSFVILPLAIVMGASLGAGKPIYPVVEYQDFENAFTPAQAVARNSRRNQWQRRNTAEALTTEAKTGAP